MNDTRKRSFWGWGWADKFPDATTRKATGKHAQLMVGFAPERCDEPPSLESIELRAPRVSAPSVLAGFVNNEHEARVRRTYGKSYRDIVRGFRGDFSPAPDLVATPGSEAEITAILDWASDAKVAVIPFGGGTSVVGGVEGDVDDRYRAVLSLDLGRLDRVVEVERSSLSARIQAGATGPGLEAQLAEQGLTLRHFPQSFEFSTLGGWVATRAGGHFATVYTHIDDLVQSTRAITPKGVWESRRLPGSGAGPSPDRLMVGSEGIFGVITEAWMRVRPRPVFRATATAHFTDYGAAVEAVRALSQSGLYPSNCRLLDKREAALNAVTMDGTHVLVVAFESADHSVQVWMERALELVADHGGTCPKGPVYREGGERSGDSDGAGVWRDAFLEAPYLLNIMASMGIIVDTFETACTWDNFERLHTGVVRDVRQAMKDACGKGFISCRFTHVYPDGPAPYFTFIAPGRHGAELDQWMTIKQAASDAVISHGGTITHHHAVGRVHRPWYEKQRPALFGDALRAVKGALDPGAVMNPGVLIDPAP
ncbi:MAG: FAD-binding oxidoreductase [Deltaproteobacteria bacterium]|nr:FAD-binding oxidoreductase [Deltaproteobacteria bacterium]MBW2209512.1 FAD-binding oxidoreductase [Deltaproteobacteria bacterium]MBW2380228.1 FAD-binding oxidoreductase [Deltaproteobacteria bacterium]MBW2550833.1 FAD-binding oxidoreductase [Deltaproteobacteria bacterium]MBW2627167.1 FAD-binding oxidoreductase [Deltaproteobacteria bacterium]